MQKCTVVVNAQHFGVYAPRFEDDVTVVLSDRTGVAARCTLVSVRVLGLTDANHVYAMLWRYRQFDELNWGPLPKKSWNALAFRLLHTRLL